MSHNNELQLEKVKIKGAANQQSESVTPIQLKQPAVSIQRVASDKSITEELQLDKEQHNSNVEETKIMASYPAVPPEDGGLNGQNTIQGKFSAPNSLSFNIPKNIQRSEKAPPLQFAKQMDGIESVAEDKSTNSNGLPQAIQSKFENALGADFSDVKIHPNSKSATEVGALAYTQGTDVHFAPGQFEPNSNSGQELLGHELTHVIQQRAGRVQPTTEVAGLSVNDDDGLEAEADEGGRKVVQGKFESEGNKIESKPENNSPKIKSLPMQMKLDQGVIQRDVPQSQQSTTPQRRSVQERVNETVEYLRGRSGHEVVGRGGDTYTRRDEHTCVRLLRENHDVINDINAAFEGNLKRYIKDNFVDWDYKIKATALLYEPHYRSPWTEVALCLIPPLTRDAEFFRILNQPATNHTLLRAKYNEYFGELGSGSLEADVDDDFDFVDYQRAHILIYRNLTDADNLYLATAGQDGTDVETVIRILRRKWGEGVGSFRAFLSQWNPNGTLPDVVSGGGNPHHFFDTMPIGGKPSFDTLTPQERSLMFTVMSEISGGYALEAQGIFLEYINRRSHSIETNQTGEQREEGRSFTVEEQSRLRLANTQIEASESGLDDTTQQHESVVNILEVYRSRISRLEASHASQSDIQYARTEYEEAQQRLRREHLSIQELTFEERQAGEINDDELYLHELNEADRLWLIRNDRVAYRNMILDLFKQNRIAQVAEEARIPKETNELIPRTIRPVFSLETGVSYDDVIRTSILSWPIGSMPERGKRYIDRYLSESTNANLSVISTFLTQGNWSPTLKNNILELYRSNSSQLTAGDLFIELLTQNHFSLLPAFPSIRDNLSPARNAQERADRRSTDVRVDTEQQGLLGDFGVRIYDVMTGEDTRDVTLASLERLNLFARNNGCSHEETHMFFEFYKNSTDLSQLEDSQFQERFDALRAGRAQVTGVVSSSVQTLTEAGLSTLLVPVFGPFAPIAAAMIGEISGIICTELFDAQAQDVFTMQNLQRVAISGITEGVGSWFEEGTDAYRMINEFSSNPLVQGAIREGLQGTSESVTELLLENLDGQLESPEFEDMILDIVSRSITGGISNNQEEVEGLIHSLRSEIRRNVIENLSRESFDISIDAVSGANVDDIGNRLSIAIGEAVRDAALEGIGEHVGESGRHHIDRSLEQRTQSASETIDSGQSVRVLSPPILVGTPSTLGHRDAILPPAPVNPQSAPIDERHVPRPIGTPPVEDNRPTLDAPTEDQIPETRVPSQTDQQRVHSPTILDERETQPAENGETNHTDSDTLSSTERRVASDTIPTIPNCHVQNIFRESDMSDIQYRAHVDIIFNRRLRSDPSREVGLYFNRLTREWIIIQGNNSSVRLPQTQQSWFQSQTSRELLRDESHLDSNWEIVAHSHPSGSEGVTITNRFPSGANGDLGVLIRNCAANNSQPQTSIIRYLDSSGEVQSTMFGVNLSHQNPIWISFIDPRTNQLVRHDFEDITSYHRYLEDRFGITSSPADPRLDEFLHNRPEPRILSGSNFSGRSEFNRSSGDGLDRQVSDSLANRSEIEPSRDTIPSPPPVSEDLDDSVSETMNSTTDRDTLTDITIPTFDDITEVTPLDEEPTIVSQDPIVEETTQVSETSPSSSLDTIFNDIPTNSDGQTSLDPDEFASRPTSQVASMDTIFNDMSTTYDGQTPLDPNQFVDSNIGNPGAIRMPNRSDLSDRRQHVEPTREYRDFECNLVNGLGARMGSSGFEGSGLGANRSTISTPDGEREVVVKIYQNTSEFRDMLNMELESARVASNTGYGPIVYGEIALVEPDLIGFAMGIAEGGFPDFADLDTFTPDERQRYREEAERSASNISFLTIDDLNDFSNRLLRSGYYYEGEIQGFVDSQSHYNPIDFQALRPLSNEANERREQIQVHERNISLERDLLAEEAFNNLSRRTITP